MLRILNDGTVEGLTASKASLSMEEGHGGAFLSAMKHSNEVFAAFKVHTMGKAMASRLYTANGNLKPFTSWVKEVLPIASHHTRAWLRTEYNTAVIRAHNAADWQEFERNKDVMPNLRWMPTTSPTPEGSHAAFWQKKLTLPVDDPFWTLHHPGDRWNCKCSLEAVDDPVNRSALDDGQAPAPQRGLENNPGKDGHIFNDTHPYFPNTCATCDFYRNANVKNKVRVLLNATRKKDCYNCPYIGEVLPSSLTQSIRKYDLSEWEHTYIAKEAGFVVTHKDRLTEAAKSKAEKEKYQKEMHMCKVLADNGHYIEHLPDRKKGGTYDITIDGIPADLKCIEGGAGNIVKYAKKVMNGQGGKAVVYEIPSHDGKYYAALAEARRKCSGKIFFYFKDDKVLKEIK